jgi:hypothetical protein
MISWDFTCYSYVFFLSRFQFFSIFGLQMRIVAFIGYLCFLLCGGGHNFYAITPAVSNSYAVAKHISEDQPIKYSTADQCTIVIEDTDIDLEEEHQGGDEVKKSNNTNFLGGKSSLPEYWRSTHSYFAFLNYCNKGLSVSQFFCDNFSPIYIKYRVLRI